MIAVLLRVDLLERLSMLAEALEVAAVVLSVDLRDHLSVMALAAPLDEAAVFLSEDSLEHR